ncbi:MAG: hypothetical protein ACREO9_02235, partial [Lysobacterales bacterium]
MLLLFLLGLLADAWLESSGGRRLLQRELGRGLGLPVSLQGNFGMRFLPQLEIAGTGLEVGLQGGRGVLVYSGSYSVGIEVVPFIRGELRIASIRLRDGFIDLANLPAPEKAEPGAAYRPAGSQISLPDVASLNVNNFSVRYADAPDRVDIGEFQLTGFRASVPASLAVKAGLFRNEAIRAAVELQGSVAVDPLELSTEFRIAAMQIALDQLLIDGLTGLWRWERPADAVSGQLDWQDSNRSAGLQLVLTLGEPLTGSAYGSYRVPELAAPVTLEFRFTLLPDSVALEGVRLAMDDQEIEGSGCFRFAEQAGLHLNLLADELDMDKIEPLLSVGKGGEV